MWGVAWVISWYKHSADKGASRTKITGGSADMAGGERMRSGSRAVLVLTLLAGVCGRRRLLAPRMPPRRACDVPAYLLTTESTLPKRGRGASGTPVR